MKRITIIGLTLLGALPFSAQADVYTFFYKLKEELPQLDQAVATCTELSDIYGNDDNSLLRFVQNPKGLQGLIARITPPRGFLECPELTMDFARRGLIGRLLFRFDNPITRIASLVIGSFIADYITSYLWGKIAKPTADSSKLHKWGYYSVAAAIPFAFPLFAVLQGGQGSECDKKFLAALCSMSMLSSYFGHKHA